MDHRTIWESPSTAAISSAIAYYQDRAQGVQWLKAVLAGIAAVSIGSASIKLAHGGLSRLLFDGGSLCGFACMLLWIYCELTDASIY